MATKRIRGKCPVCCPDGGAIFKESLRFKGEGETFEDRWERVKECCNCGHEMPIRRIKVTGKLTSSQRRILNRIVELGWTIERQDVIGRKVWISAVKRDRSMWVGDAFFGTIGVGGSFEFTLQQVGGSKKLRDKIDLNVYLG